MISCLNLATGEDNLVYEGSEPFPEAVARSGNFSNALLQIYAIYDEHFFCLTSRIVRRLQTLMVGGPSGTASNLGLVGRDFVALC